MEENNEEIDGFRMMAEESYKEEMSKAAKTNEEQQKAIDKRFQDAVLKNVSEEVQEIQV
jgi:hypothetical protein